MAHVSPHPSPSPAAPRKEHGPPLRILVVAAEEGGGLVQSARQWAGDAGLELETAPDLPRAVRQLAAKRWDVVLALLGEHADEDLAWWVDALRGATGSPRLVAVAQAPSMGLVLRAEKLGVLDLLSLPLRRDDLLQALRRVRAAAAEVPVALPAVEDPACRAGARDRAGRRRGNDPGGRAADRRDQPRPARADHSGPVPRGPVLPAGGRDDPLAEAGGPR